MATDLSKLKRQIVLVARAKYAGPVGRASAYLKLAFAPRHTADNVALMACVLSEHDWPHSEGKTVKRDDVPAGDPIDSDRIRGIEFRLRQRVFDFLAQDGFTTSTLTSEEAARQVVDFLMDLPSVEERTVAFALMLVKGIAPYVQIPEDLIESDPEALAKRMSTLNIRPRLLRSLILLDRISRRPATTVGQAMMARAKILISHADQPEEIAALLALLELKTLQSARAAAPSIAILEIGGPLAALLAGAGEDERVSSAPDELLERHIRNCSDPACRYSAELKRRRAAS